MCRGLDVGHREDHASSTDSAGQLDELGASGSETGISGVSGSVYFSQARKRTKRTSATVTQASPPVDLSQGLLRATAGRGRG